MKTLKELKDEAALEVRAIADCERRKLVDLIDGAIRRGLMTYVGPENLEVYVKVPGYHLYRSRGNAVPSPHLQHVLEEYRTRGIRSSVKWENVGANKDEPTRFKIVVPGKLLREDLNESK